MVVISKDYSPLVILCNLFYLVALRERPLVVLVGASMSAYINLFFLCSYYFYIVLVFCRLNKHHSDSDSDS